MDISDPWYANLAEKYGQDFAYQAGYFEETRPFLGSYFETFPELQNAQGCVLVFSGAFFPFHEGHRSVVDGAIATRIALGHPAESIFVVIHMDHSEYRHSKGSYDEQRAVESISEHMDGLNWILIQEDKMPMGCSRNFTRLYSEIAHHNPGTTTFISGGDRANFALAFLDKGNVVIVGRDTSEMFQKHTYLTGIFPRIMFRGGNLPLSSSEIRSNSTQ